MELFVFLPSLLRAGILVSLVVPLLAPYIIINHHKHCANNISIVATTHMKIKVYVKIIIRVSDSNRRIDSSDVHSFFSDQIGTQMMMMIQHDYDAVF